MAIIAIVGRHNYSLEKAISGLRRNKIWLHLISNSISGNHISLVIDNEKLHKAVNVVHNQVFGVIKTINLFAFGKGTVGGKLIDQILATSTEVVNRRNLRINIVGVADSKKAIFNATGIKNDWRSELEEKGAQISLDDILIQLTESTLENIIIADNTSSQELADQYPKILSCGIDIVASNKKANSGSYESYEGIRLILKKTGRSFNYETNVGAGLPIIDTIRHLQDSADNVRRVRGVFSGSLSYLFNTFSDADGDFSEVLEEARLREFTEPDPREDLTGLDVARKLIILTRELGLSTELNQVKVQSLIPEELSNEKDYNSFLSKRKELDKHFSLIKASLNENEVLRYVGDINIPENTLEVSLIKVPRDSPLGNIKDADALFEIYTSDYGEQPIVIQGAGAGGEVTARGVYSDLIKIGSKF